MIEQHCGLHMMAMLHDECPACRVAWKHHDAALSKLAEVVRVKDALRRGSTATNEMAPPGRLNAGEGEWI
jgi:leucyl aminopeptidase (aminopeptidase T)